MATPAPEELFAEWRRTREPALLGAVFDAVAPRLLGLALHLCREPADAEDAVQATFLTAIEKAESWDERRPLEPWLGAILTRRAQQRAASDARRPRLERMNFAEPVDPEIEARHMEAVELLRRKSESFPPETRTLLLLRLEHGLEPAEIAEVLGRPAGTIRVQLQRALERLRRVWPASLALAALGVVLPSRGLALIRAEILRHAGTIGVAAAGEVAASAAGALLVKKALAIVALLLAASGIAWWWIDGSVAEPPLELRQNLAVEERLASKTLANAAAEVEPIHARSAGSAAEPAEEANANELELALVWASDRTPAPGIGLALEPAADAAAVSKRRLQRRELRSDEQGLVQVRGLSP
ncbi:MAG: RNA polymerase sigma factor, partial [Planctomycetes bacterium]|nr:RNA polymerase sigma factor [Planctomycetota bacterium]